MGESSKLRDRSAHCARLIKDMTDPEIIANLKTIATECDEAASALDDVEAPPLAKP
jgi:hypothetical protein